MNAENKSLTYVEIDVPAFAAIQGDAYFDDFTYLTRGAGLNGAADSKLWTFSCWLRIDSGLGGRLITGQTSVGGAAALTRIVQGGSGNFSMNGYNSAGVEICNLQSSVLPTDVWVHVMGSADMTDTGKRHLYVNGVSDLAIVGVYTNDTIDFTYADWTIGAYGDGSSSFNGSIAEMWFAPGVYIDLSVAANRQKFISSTLHQVNLGDHGELPTGTPPLVYLGNNSFNWEQNLGTGGDFEVNGNDLLPSVVETETFRFAQDCGYLPTDIDCIASLTSIAFTPAVISLGKDLGQRASLTCGFKDHKHRFIDDDPTMGSFWGKWRARYGTRLRGIPLRWINGLLGQSLAQMETRHFVVESTDGPTLNATYSIVAKDALKLTDGDRAQAPLLSNGALVGDITNVATSLTLTPDGIGDLEYPFSGYIAVGGEEVMSFVRVGGNDANTMLLCHFDGPDESTTASFFNDSSSFGRTATRIGNVKIDTAQFVFGGSSAFFDGTDDGVTFPDDNAWTFTGDFTIEARIRPTTSLAAIRTILHHGDSGSNRWQFRVQTDGSLHFFEIVGGVGTFGIVSAASLITIDTWYHVACVRSGNVFKLYINGVEVATQTSSVVFTNFASVLDIGLMSDSNAEDFLGWIDEVRISNVARWTDDFTPFGINYQDPDILDLDGRGLFDTTAVAHQAGDRVQLCLRYVGMDPADIIFDLFTNYANIPSIWCPLSAWKNETAAYLQRVYTTIIAEPTDVRTLIDEIIEQAAMAIWWDPVGQQIRLQVLRAILTDAQLFTPDNTMEGSLQIQEQPAERISQVWTYFGMRNPLEGVEEEQNFRSTLLTIDPETEIGYGSPAIKKIFSRWIPFGGRSIAERLNNIQIGRFRNPPRRFNFNIFNHNGNSPVLGGGYRLEAWPIQNVDGTPTNAPIQITRLMPGADKFQIEAQEMLFDNVDPTDLVDRVIIVDANNYNLNMRTMHDSLYPVPTGFESPPITVTCIIESGVLVYSQEANLPAFDVGTWPAGFDETNLTLEVIGEIRGAGGDGGLGGSAFGEISGAALDGEDGGIAIYTRTNITLIDEDGLIYGGGGGGGGGSYRGGGGGGGAGQIPGDGGLRTTSQNDPSDGSPGTQDFGGAGGDGGGSWDADGGDGGAPGQDGGDGEQDAGFLAGEGGAGGAAIDGISFITQSGPAGDREGPEIN